MIVLDASAGVDLLHRNRERGDAIGARLAEEFAVHVPAVFDLEVVHAFRGLERAGTLEPDRIEAALRALTALRAVRHDHQILRPRIWELRANLTAYDAAYVALAELLDATLITADRRLARTGGHDALIEVV